MGGPRSGADGPRSRACGDADPAASRSRLERSRRVGDQRSVRGAGDRVRARVGRAPTIAGRSSASPRALGTLDEDEAQRRRRRDCARPSGRRVGRAHRAARAQRAEAHRRASAGWRRSASAAAWAARCWSSESDRSNRPRSRARQPETRDATLDPRPRCRRHRAPHPRPRRRDDEHACRAECSRNSTRRSISSTAIRRDGLVIASGKANGFIAGADVDEFGEVENEADAIAIVQARLGHVRAPRRGQVSDASRSSAASVSAAVSSWRSPAAIASSSTSPARGSGCPK